VGSTAPFGGACGVFQGGSGANDANNGYGIYVSRGNAAGGISNDAGVFNGDVDVTGTLHASAKEFKIDHPLDPANKYLVHASVESSEEMNIYTGNVVTDQFGNAVVKLPDWFQTLNTDFRYQLTVIGQFAQAIVSKEIENNQFTISTNATFVKVSWQVTGVRQDPYAKAHPLVVEQQKPVNERGFYIHPELYGQPEEKQTEWGRNPQMMRRLKARRQQGVNHAEARPELNEKTQPDKKAIGLNGPPSGPAPRP
jgi:trimeric autotransporter adhesin